MMKKILPYLTLLLAGSSLQAVDISHDHVDIGVGYDGDWEFEVHDETSDTAYEPDDVRFIVNPEFSATARSASSSYDFIGVGAGETYYLLPTTQHPELPYLGFATEEMNPADFMAWDTGDSRLDGVTAKWVRFDLLSVSGPGDFSAFTTFDGVTDWMASSDGITAEDSLYVLAASHAHYNIAFSALGNYEVTFSVTSMLSNGQLSTSAPATFSFAVPEPSHYASLTGVFALLALAVMRRRSA